MLITYIPQIFNPSTVCYGNASTIKFTGFGMFSFIVHYPPIYPGASQKYPLTTTDSKVCGT